MTKDYVRRDELMAAIAQVRRETGGVVERVVHGKCDCQDRVQRVESMGMAMQAVTEAVRDAKKAALAAAENASAAVQEAEDLKLGAIEELRAFAFNLATFFGPIHAQQYDSLGFPWTPTHNQGAPKSRMFGLFLGRIEETVNVALDEIDAIKVALESSTEAEE